MAFVGRLVSELFLPWPTATTWMEEVAWWVCFNAASQGKSKVGLRPGAWHSKPGSNNIDDMIGLQLRIIDESQSCEALSRTMKRQSTQSTSLLEKVDGRYSKLDCTRILAGVRTTHIFLSQIDFVGFFRPLDRVHWHSQVSSMPLRWLIRERLPWLFHSSVNLRVYTEDCQLSIQTILILFHRSNFYRHTTLLQDL